MESLFESLNIERDVILAQLLAFGVLLVLLTRFLYRPLESILRQRQEQIANSLTAAEAQHLQAESLRREYEAKLAEMAEAARARMEQVMQEAEAARQQLLENTAAEIRALQERNAVQLARERDRLRRELSAEIADLAVQAATTALRRPLEPTTHAAVIEQAIRDVENLPLQ